jgi:hypothetical protein
MADYITCEGCNCLLRAEDGPLCAACEHEKRSEAAKKAAETRAERREDVDVAEGPEA